MSENKVQASLEDKIRIVARAFFQDNPNDYEDYHAALSEFMNRENTSDKFIEFGAEPFLKCKPGHVLVIREIDGHLATVRESDGYLEPVFEMTKDEGESMMDSFHEASEKYPDLDGVPLLLKTGWKLLEANQ